MDLLEESFEENSVQQPFAAMDADRLRAAADASIRSLLLQRDDGPVHGRSHAGAR